MASRVESLFHLKERNDVTFLSVIHSVLESMMNKSLDRSAGASPMPVAVVALSGVGPSHVRNSNRACFLSGDSEPSTRTPSVIPRCRDHHSSGSRAWAEAMNAMNVSEAKSLGFIFQGKGSVTGIGRVDCVRFGLLIFVSWVLMRWKRGSFQKKNPTCHNQNSGSHVAAKPDRWGRRGWRMVAGSENLVVVLNDGSIGTQLLGHGLGIGRSMTGSRLVVENDRCHGDSQNE